MDTQKQRKKERNIQERYLEEKSLVNRQNRILKRHQDSSHSTPSVILMTPPTPSGSQANRQLQTPPLQSWLPLHSESAKKMCKF